MGVSVPKLQFVILALVGALAFPGQALAQDRAGNDTPGEWKVTHFEPYGLWETICDERKTGENLEQRCYVRYVEVFSPRPNFGAAFAFVQPDTDNGGVKHEYSFEQGTTFSPDGFRIEVDGKPTWSFDTGACIGGTRCVLLGPQAADVAAVIGQPAESITFALDFTDKIGRAWNLRWESGKLADAIADMLEQAKSRDLL